MASAELKMRTTNQKPKQKHGVVVALVTIVQRDKDVYKRLEERGWHVIVVWECELKKAVFEDNMTRLIS